MPSPPGMTAYLFVGQACAQQTPDCQKGVAALDASAASAARSDQSGGATFPGVPPGTYHLVISAPINGQPMVWEQAVTLHAGANSLTLTAATAQPLK